MSVSRGLRSLLATEKPLVTPGAYDALSARLIEHAGFKAIAVGGSAMLAARYALPDLGLAALGEMTADLRDIVEAVHVPVLVDGDDGYGGVRNVARLVEVYGTLGVAGIVLEDQVRELKQQGDDKAIGLAPATEMVRKLRTAVSVHRIPICLSSRGAMPTTSTGWTEPSGGPRPISRPGRTGS